MIGKNKYTARTAEAQSLGEVIKKLLDTYRLNSRYNETYVAAQWEAIVGKSIASRTQKLNIKNKVLYITMNSSAMAQELYLAKTRFIELINEKMGEQVIDDIIFV